ncbi:MAG TPA: chemotaxis protein CheX [Vicinamibacterales bacterium]|nr:chemotaxis protein CheX [Vicinamibacterales bacterium]
MTIPAELLSNLMSSTEEVFETMVFKPLVRMPPVETEVERKGANVVATVAFAGHRRGLVCIHSSVDAARNIAGAMLGMAEEEITSEIPDAMGEVANMVAGTFRNKLAAIEPASAIAVPTVTIGSDFSTKYLSAVRRARCPFEMEGQPISVELILTGEEAA